MRYNQISSAIKPIVNALTSRRLNRIRKQAVQDRYSRKYNQYQKLTQAATEQNIKLRRRYSNIKKVKTPTEKSFNRLNEAIEYIKSQIWAQEVLDKMNERERIEGILREPVEDEIIVNNFKSFVNSMLETSYNPQYQIWGDSPKKGQTDQGGRAKEWSADQLRSVINFAIDKRGVHVVAMSIQANGEYLQQLAEDMIFAIYNSKYAEWGGGFGAYEAAKDEFRAILMGDYDPS